MKFNNYFSSNLKFLRNQHNLLQDQLGKSLNKDNSTIGKWENGSRSPTMEDTLAICEFFNISLDKLVLTDLRIINDVELSEEKHLDYAILNKVDKLSEDDKKDIIKIIDKYSK